MLARAQRSRIPDADAKVFHIAEPASSSPAVAPHRIRETAAALIQATEAPSFRLPMLPESANEALILANDPNTPMNRLDRVVARDPVLAARVLAVASSSVYAGTAVRSLAAALQRLGSGAVRDILYQSVMQCHMFRGEDEKAARLQQDHAIATGRIAKAICSAAGCDGSQAFVCGLLHDIGQVALRLLKGHPSLALCAPAEVTAVHDVVHTTLGARMATKWKLPDEVIEGIRRHHRFRDWEPGAYSKSGHVIAAADVVADHLGVGGPPKPLGEQELGTITELGVDPANLIAVAQQAFANGV